MPDTKRGPRAPNGRVVCLVFLSIVAEKGESQLGSDGKLRRITVQVARQMHYRVGKCCDERCRRKCQ